MINKIVNYIKDNNFKIYYVNNSIDIINYDEIVDITSDTITIIKENKIVLIKGKLLRLTKLLDNEVLITGEIHKIEL